MIRNLLINTVAFVGIIFSVAAISFAISSVISRKNRIPDLIAGILAFLALLADILHNRIFASGFPLVEPTWFSRFGGMIFCFYRTDFDSRKTFRENQKTANYSRAQYSDFSGNFRKFRVGISSRDRKLALTFGEFREIC